MSWLDGYEKQVKPLSGVQSQDSENRGKMTAPGFFGLPPNSERKSSKVDFSRSELGLFDIALFMYWKKMYPDLCVVAQDSGGQDRRSQL